MARGLRDEDSRLTRKLITIKLLKSRVVVYGINTIHEIRKDSSHLCYEYRGIDT